MPEKSQLIVGLEIGTSKVCAVVGELGANDALNIIAVGNVRSRGVRKGEIADAAQVEEDIRNAVVEAEQKADMEIRSVFLGITGGHVRGFINRGVHPVVSADREITSEDVEDVLKNARAINIPAENTILQTVRQHFIVDGQEGVTDPVGFLGARLEADLHVVHGNANRISNSVRAVRSLGLEVAEVVFNGIASALGTLDAEQKELGTLVIDIGGGTTDYVLYANGIIKHSGVLAVGGDHVTSDLAQGLKISQSRADQLKMEHGTALVDDPNTGQFIEVPGSVGLPSKRINLDHLRQIMALRVEETLELVAMELDRAGMLPWVRSGVVLCGGCAKIPQLDRLASQIFSVPATVARSVSASGLKSALDEPEFATAIGIVKFGAMQAKRFETPRRGIIGILQNTLGGLMGR